MSDPVTQPAPVGSAALHGVARLAMWLAALSLIGVAVVEGWQVFARYVLNNSPSWTEPLALLLMSNTMMLGAALGVRNNKHFGFFLLGDLVPAAFSRLLHRFAQLAMLLVGLLFVVGGLRLGAQSWDFPMAGAPLPAGIVYVPICIGGALIALFAVERMVLERRRGTG